MSTGGWVGMGWGVGWGVGMLNAALSPAAE